MDKSKDLTTYAWSSLDDGDELFGHSMLWDSQNSRLLVFGGQKGASEQYRDQLMEWKSAEEPRCSHSKVFGPKVSCVVGHQEIYDIARQWAYIVLTGSHVNQRNGTAAVVRLCCLSAKMLMSLRYFCRTIGAIFLQVAILPASVHSTRQCGKAPQRSLAKAAPTPKHSLSFGPPYFQEDVFEGWHVWGWCDWLRVDFQTLAFCWLRGGFCSPTTRV